MTSDHNRIRKFIASCIALLSIGMLCFFSVSSKAPDQTTNFLLTILPSAIGFVSLLAITSKSEDFLATFALLLFSFIVFNGNAYQVLRGENTPAKICALNFVALCFGTLSLTLYHFVIKNKVLTSKEGYKKAISITIAAIGALFFILLLFGENIGGARLWLRLGSYTVELTEIIKLLFFILLALIFNSDMNVRLKVFYATASLLGCAAFLALLNEFGSLLIMLCVYMIAFCIHIRHKFAMLMLLIFAIITVITLLVVFGFYDKAKEADGLIASVITKLHDRLSLADTYQVDRAIRGMINGGLFGINNLDSVFYTYSMEADFVLSGIAQYFGLINMIVCIVAVMALVYITYARNHDDKVANTSRYKLAIIFMSSVAVQTAFCLASNIGLPCTGVGAPLLSAGGTQMMISYAEAGFVVYGLLSENTVSSHPVPLTKYRKKRNEFYDDEI